MNIEEWVFFGVYGPTLRAEIEDFLGELDDLKGRWDLLWCIGGISIWLARGREKVMAIEMLEWKSLGILLIDGV